MLRHLYGWDFLYCGSLSLKIPSLPCLLPPVFTLEFACKPELARAAIRVRECKNRGIQTNMSIFYFLPVVFWKSVLIFLNTTYFRKAYLSYFMKSYLSISTLKCTACPFSVFDDLNSLSPPSYHRLYDLATKLSCTHWDVTMVLFNLTSRPPKSQHYTTVVADVLMNVLNPRNHLLGAISNALVLSNFFIQLQLSLDILGGVGDANLDTARDSSGNDALQKSVGTAGT